MGRKSKEFNSVTSLDEELPALRAFIENLSQKKKTKFKIYRQKLQREMTELQLNFLIPLTLIFFVKSENIQKQS